MDKGSFARGFCLNKKNRCWISPLKALSLQNFYLGGMGRMVSKENSNLKAPTKNYLEHLRNDPLTPDQRPKFGPGA